MKLKLALQSLYHSLEKVPVPEGVTSHEIVHKAIEFTTPPRIPYCMFYNPTKGDIFDIGFITKWLRPNNPTPTSKFYIDDWQVKWQVTGRWWDTAVGHPLTDLRALNDYNFPKVVPRGMYILFKVFARLARHKGKYIVVPNLINMYERSRSLMGFEELIVAPYKQPDLLEELLDHLANMTIDMIEQYGKSGLFDAFMTWEDWGLQNRLHMSIDTFNQFYKPRYKRIIDSAHQNNMHFIWHCCGHILSLLPEMIDLQVDVIQLDQPRLMGHQNLIDIVGGKLCMWNCLDIQWSNYPQRTNTEIQTEIQDMIKVYNIQKFQGGFIFRNYPDPMDIKISKTRQGLINDIFLQEIQ